MLLLLGSTLPPAGRIEEQARAVVSPLVASLGDLARPVGNVVLRANEVDRLAGDNAALRLEVERLQSELAALREQQTIAGAAAELYGSARLAPDQALLAPVLLRDPAPGQRAFLIGRGADDGVLVGQPVLGPGGTLVGVVAQVEAGRAWLRLLTDVDAAVAVTVQSSRTLGALVGTGDGLSLELVERGKNVAIGDILVTSVLGDRLPAGLVAGRVTAVRSNAQALHQTITVEPLTDPRRLEQVLVLTSFRPVPPVADTPIARPAP
ncbi:MAG: rod shape-determining protein MreC [Chloroflexi bacterium]|nr:rod shape-determining protein MreC [Chloroflexota bacterium]MDA1147875.1 rod shape-determining protein MreC [Chloroflexota bacterium]